MVTFGSSRQSTRSAARGSGIVIEGDDLLVQQFTREAVTARPKAGAVVVLFAGKAAERMRSRVPIDEGDLLDSITADKTPTLSPMGAYADAGPDPSANPGAFKGHMIERGTVKMGPRPFVGPAGDETLPEFVEAMKRLPSL